MREHQRIQKCLMIFAAVSLGVILAGCGEQKKNATDYITPVFKGLNSEGTVTLKFDADKLKEDISEKKELSDDQLSSLDQVISGIEANYTVSESSGLSNGDQIDITSELDEKLLKSFGIKLENSTLQATVEGLAEELELSLNDYLDFAPAGFTGDGSITITLDEEALKSAVLEQAGHFEDSDDREQLVDEAVAECAASLTIEPSTFDHLSEGEMISASVAFETVELPAYAIFFTAQNIETPASGFAPYETISLPDYYGVIPYGYDGYGSAELTIDTEKLAAQLKELFVADSRGAYGPADGSTDFDAEAQETAEQIRSAWQYAFESEFNAPEDLSNGDEIPANSRPFENPDEDEYVLDTIGAILTGGEGTVVVEGLIESAEMDISDYLSVTFKGLNGGGYASLEYDDEGFQAALDELIISRDPSVNPDTFMYPYAYDFLHGAYLDEETLTSLTEGDEVSADVHLTYEGIPEYGITFTASPVLATVSSLEPYQTLEMDKYVDLQITGFSGGAKVTAKIDEDALRRDLEALISGEAPAEEAAGEEAEEETAEEAAEIIEEDASEEEPAKVGEEAEEEAGEETEEAADEAAEEETAEEEAAEEEPAEAEAAEEAVEEPAEEEAVEEEPAEAEAAEEAAEEETAEEAEEEAAPAEDSGAGWEVEKALTMVVNTWENNFTVEAEEGSVIRNGETAVIAAEPVDGIFLNSIGILMKGFTREVTLEEGALPELKNVDVSEVLDVTFTGICPFVTAHRTINTDLPFYDKDAFAEEERNEQIQAENGDEYSGTIEYDPAVLAQDGYAAMADTYSYTVTGLNTWTLGLEDPDDIRLDDFRTAAEETAAAKLAEGDLGAAVIDVVWYAASPLDNWNGNAIAFAGHSESDESALFAVWFRNVYLTPDNAFISGEEPRIALYVQGEDAFEEWKGQMISQLGPDAEIKVLGGELVEIAETDGEEEAAEEAVEEAAEEAVEEAPEEASEEEAPEGEGAETEEAADGEEAPEETAEETIEPEAEEETEA